ncbi:hypothetical protein UT300007_10270 [Clostridium sp. CTA-7]
MLNIDVINNYTLEQHEASMTLFYMKRTGEIQRYSTGIQGMKYFGGHEEDYKLIIDFIVLEKDQYVLDNIEKFKIVDKKLILKGEYRVNLDKYQ